MLCTILIINEKFKTFEIGRVYDKTTVKYLNIREY